MEERKQAMRSALSYLYSYRCMGKVGNLLARPPPSLPLPIFNLPPSFSTDLPSPRAASSPAINTKNSQGQTAPPRFIAYEFQDLSIAATCLSPVTADPHLPSRALGFEPCLAVGRYLFPRNKRHESRLPPLRVLLRRYQKRMQRAGHDPRLLDIVNFHPWFRYSFFRREEGVFLLFEND